MASTGTGTSVLDDVRILEVGGVLGGWCGKLLADMGANVIKVEPPEGDETRGYPPFYKDEPDKNRSLYFWHYNTNKQSVTLDIESDIGRDVFLRLAVEADVIVDSCEPKYLDSLGLGYDDVSQVSPSIIFAAISPFGQDAPYSNFAATDLTALAFGGPVWSSGYDDHSIPPVRGGGNQAYHTACHFAAIGVLTALVHRQFTGEGQFIDVNMHAAQNVTTEGAVYHWLVAGDTVQRQTGRHSSPTPTADVQMLCGDGRYVNIGFPARTEEQWFHLLAWLDEHGLMGDLSKYITPPSRAAIINRDADAIRQMAEVMSAVSESVPRRIRHTTYSCGRRTWDFSGGLSIRRRRRWRTGTSRSGGCRCVVPHPELERGVRVCGRAIRIQGDAVGYQATTANAWGGQRGGVWGDWDWNGRTGSDERGGGGLVLHFLPRFVVLAHVIDVLGDVALVGV